MPGPSTALAKEFRSIRTTFRQLATSFSRIAPILTAVPDVSTVAVGEKRPLKKPRISRAYRATLRLQGKYMGTMRGLKPRQRAQVKRIRAETGIRSAIAAAERMAG
jgi:hypothetical protein